MNLTNRPIEVLETTKSAETSGTSLDFFLHERTNVILSQSVVVLGSEYIVLTGLIKPHYPFSPLDSLLTCCGYGNCYHTVTNSGQRWLVACRSRPVTWSCGKFLKAMKCFAIFFLSRIPLKGSVLFPLNRLQNALMVTSQIHGGLLAI